MTTQYLTTITHYKESVDLFTMTFYVWNVFFILTLTSSPTPVLSLTKSRFTTKSPFDDLSGIHQWTSCNTKFTSVLL